MDMGYELVVPEEDRWHENHKGDERLLEKLNSTCVGTLKASLKNLRYPDAKRPKKELKLPEIKLNPRLEDKLPTEAIQKGITLFLTEQPTMNMDTGDELRTKVSKNDLLEAMLGTTPIKELDEEKDSLIDDSRSHSMKGWESAKKVGRTRYKTTKRSSRDNLKPNQGLKSPN